MTVSLKLALYPPFQKTVADHVLLLGLGSRCLSSMLKINVALPNGHAELLTVLPSSTLQELKTAAQQALGILGKTYLKLITAKNRI